MTKQELIQNGYVALEATFSELLNTGRSVGVHKISFVKGTVAQWRPLKITLDGKEEEKLYPFLYGMSATKLISAGCPVERKDETVKENNKTVNYVKFVVNETKTLFIEVYENKDKKKINGRYPKAVKVLWDKTDEEKEEE
jgi:hypothetical protein